MDKAGGYIRIYQGMISRLHLGGYSLLLFGMITGYTESGHGWHYSLTSAANLLGTSRAVVARCLAGLLESGYIVRTPLETGNGLKRYNYFSRYGDILDQLDNIPAVEVPAKVARAI